MDMDRITAMALTSWLWRTVRRRLLHHTAMGLEWLWSAGLETGPSLLLTILHIPLQTSPVCQPKKSVAGLPLLISASAAAPFTNGTAPRLNKSGW
jgi:hypothetical protein